MKTLVLIIGLLCSTASAALAVSARDYVNTLKPHERSAYLFGALDMVMSEYNAQKRFDKAKCVRQWFAEHPDKANAALWEAMRSSAVQDYAAAVAVRFVIERHCRR